MADGHQVDRSWMWHPSFSEQRSDTAGFFVYFKKDLIIGPDLPASLPLHVTADTRYKLYVNNRLVSCGPTKGDQHLWFYDEVDIGQHLRTGHNKILIVVLRFFYATRYAASFPRLPNGGLRVVEAEPGSASYGLGSSIEWQTTIDHSTILRVDEPEDDFLHVYEFVGPHQRDTWNWVPAKLLEYQTSTGNSTPWNLSPRLIPPMDRSRQSFSTVRNVKSSVSPAIWAATLCNSRVEELQEIHLAPLSHHCIDLEVPHHTTGFLEFRFKRPETTGSVMSVTYSESYEEPPRLVPYLRRKTHRCDDSKELVGPRDIYHFQGPSDARQTYWNDWDRDEVFAPFHFRTFRFLRVQFNVGSSELVLKKIDIESVNYPLNVLARLRVPSSENLPEKLWDTSVRTLKNCMHECYEDCPFYEQLQYAMDTRSSALFTYCLSGDDRLARQAITQIHNSFQTRIGLTASRAPSHNLQIIPHFSLFWICMLSDHLTYFGDVDFLRPFVPAIDAILGYFHQRLDSELGLVVTNSQPGIWNFTDWAEEWRPYGIPPAVEETGISTYTNNLYAYSLKQAASVLSAIGRSNLATEYHVRAGQVVDAIRLRCFDGQLFTDSITSSSVKSRDYSQHNQVWAVLSGAATQQMAADILRRSYDAATSVSLVKTSISMSFYTLRAFSVVGEDVYNTMFHTFWTPWVSQLELGLTTWEEDTVSQRSDCHAWGSAPIYEFMAEVAGIRPAGLGWSMVHFQPRINLYKEFAASVPIWLPKSSIKGVAHVSWTTMNSGNVTVRLSFEMNEEIAVPVYVKLPSQEPSLVESTQDLTFAVMLRH